MHHPGLRDATNAEALFRLLDDGAGQLTWYHSVPGRRGSGSRALRWREAAIDDARAGIAEAYAFLIDCWEPGDRIFIFGVGRGAFCARELSRLLGTIGVLPAEWDDLVDYVLASLRAAAHAADAAGLAAGQPAGGPAGRAARNRRACTVFGAVGHGEGAGVAEVVDG